MRNHLERFWFARWKCNKIRNNIDCYTRAVLDEQKGISVPEVVITITVLAIVAMFATIINYYHYKETICHYYHYHHYNKPLCSGSAGVPEVPCGAGQELGLHLPVPELRSGGGEGWDLPSWTSRGGVGEGVLRLRISGFGCRQYLSFDQAGGFRRGLGIQGFRDLGFRG